MKYLQEFMRQRATLYMPAYAAVSCCVAIIGYHALNLSILFLLGATLIGAGTAWVLMRWPETKGHGHSSKQYPHSLNAVIGLLLMAAVVGIICAAFYSGLRSSEWRGGGLPAENIKEIQGTLLEDSRPWGSGGRYLIRLQALRNHHTEVRLAATLFCYSAEWFDIVRGSTLTAHVQWHSSKERRPEKHRSRQTPECALSAITVSHTDIQVENNESQLSLRSIGVLRKTLQNALVHLLNRFPKPSAQLLKALLLGRRTELSSTLRQSFRQAGVSHLLALSGMHLAILVSLIGFLLHLFCNRNWVIAVAALWGLAYLWLIGSNPSLERAVIMFTLWSILKLRGRQSSHINLIGLAFLVMVLVHHRAVTELSFQLSFGALSGILLLAPYIGQPLKRYLPQWLALSLSTSLAAQLFTLPFLLLYFDAWYLVGIIATIVLSPLVAIYMWQAILWLPIMAVGIPYLEECGAVISFVLFELIRRLAQWLAQTPAVPI